MTLYEITQAIVEAATRQPTIHTIARGDFQKINSAPSVKYGAFAYIQGSHSSDEDFFTYNFTFVYADRVTEDRSNEELIQSTGILTLDNIIAQLEEVGCIKVSVTYDVFTDRFSDDCAVAMAKVGLRVPRSYVCADDTTIPDKTTLIL